MHVHGTRGRTALPSALVVVVACALLAAAAATASAPPASQELALFLRAHTAVTQPGSHGRPMLVVSRTRPITEERTALPVIGHVTGPRGTKWLRVLLPGRPNGRSGWIKQEGTYRRDTPWRIVIRTSQRRVTVYERGHAVRSFEAVVGKPSTPTPVGRFFVEEAIELSSSDVGAPYALALSARSNVLQEFAGGPGQIALHGLQHVGGVLGTAASHGCVRLGNDVMRWLVYRVGPGVPVTVEQ
jgi:lipoprotein-anchoring transpeptidase ErfK/SrfK